MRDYLNVKNEIVWLIGILIVLLTFNNNIILSPIGTLAVFSLTFFCVALLVIFIMKRNLYIKLTRSVIYYSSLFILLIAVYIMAYFSYTNFSGIKNILQLMLILGFTLFIRIVKWDTSKTRILGKISSILVLVFAVLWLTSGMPKDFKAYMGNPNAFAAFLFSILYFIIVNIINKPKNEMRRIYYIISLLIGVILIYLSGSRSVFLAGITLISVFILFKFITKRQFIHSSFFFLVSLSVISFTFYYPRLYNYPLIYNLLNDVSMIFGKSFYTGRELIWKDILDSVNNIWFGSGAGVTTVELTGSAIGTHNLYIQLIMQVGVLGLILFFMILFSMWRELRLRYCLSNNRNEKKVIALSSSFLLAIIVHQTFEVTFTQNNFGIGLMQWFVITIGISIKLPQSQKIKKQ